MRGLLSAALMLVGVAAGCSQVPRDPLRLEGDMLTVENQSTHDWHDIEIWINQYFRATAPHLTAGGRLQVRLDSFVSGYARRFDVRRLPVGEMRLSATQADGEAITLRRDFSKNGLAALGDGHQ